MRDPLSDVMSLLRVHNYSAGAIDAGGDWSIQFPVHKGVKCYAVESGHCYLAVEGASDLVRIQKGDCFVLSQGEASV